MCLLRHCLHTLTHRCPGPYYMADLGPYYGRHGPVLCHKCVCIMADLGAYYGSIYELRHDGIDRAGYL